jgi:hypothetical protein
MCRSGKIKDFDKNTACFQFKNYTNSGSIPFPVLTLPLGIEIPGGDAGDGICDGMVFSVLDLFHHDPRLYAPQTTSQPVVNSATFKYMTGREVDIWRVNGFWNPNKAVSWLFKEESELASLSKAECDVIMDRIDAGEPCPLWLVNRFTETETETAPYQITDIAGIKEALTRHHQILAYGYELDSVPGSLVLTIYDPDVDIISDPTTLTLPYSDDKVGFPAGPTKGLFLSKYEPKDPADPRAFGYPRTEDLASAYGLLRLLLRSQTDEEIQQPVPPVPNTDLSKQAQDLVEELDRVAQAAAQVVASPGDVTSYAELAKDLLELFLFTLLLGIKVPLAIAAEIDKVLHAAGISKTTPIDLATDPVGYGVRYGLYLFNTYLFELYKASRDALVANGYAIPYFSDLSAHPLYAGLWTAPGNPSVTPGSALTHYPYELRPEQRDGRNSSNPYRPLIPPGQYPVPTVEEPPLSRMAPYGQGELADAFISDPNHPIRDNMFCEQGLAARCLATVSRGGDPNHQVVSFSCVERDFGAAIPNCIKAIKAVVQKAGLVLPNFNLDGDRGYAWPTWDIKRDAKHRAIVFLDPYGFEKLTADPADPNDVYNPGSYYQPAVVDIDGNTKGI